MPSQIVTTFGLYATAPTHIVRFMVDLLADARRNEGTCGRRRAGTDHFDI
jgi:hypothetical protein